MTAIADEIEKRIGGLQSTVEEIIQVSAQSAARCSSLESEKTKLMKDKEALQAELEREKGNGADHRTVIHNLQEMLDSLQRQRKDMMLETDKDLTAQGEVMRMKYEVSCLPFAFCFTDPCPCRRLRSSRPRSRALSESCLEVALSWNSCAWQINS